VINNPLSNIKDSELSHTLYLKGLDLAEAEKQWILSDKSREGLLEALTDEIVDRDKVSYTKAKTMARNASEYTTFIKQMAQAKADKIIARAKYASVDAEIRIRLNKNYMARRELNSGHMDT